MLNQASCRDIAAQPRQSQPDRSTTPAAAIPPIDIIPVGQEPRRQKTPGEDVHRGAATRKIAAPEPMNKKSIKTTKGGNLHSPKNFFSLKDRAENLRIFTQETMGTLRRAELVVWLAIFNCEFKGVAQIGYNRLVEITGTSKRHIGSAIKSLEKRGLLEVVFRGSYRPNQGHANAGSGISSTYRLHPRPAMHLIGKVPKDNADKQLSPNDLGADKLRKPK